MSVNNYSDDDLPLVVITLSISNETQYPVRLDSQKLASGSWDIAPPGLIQPGNTAYIASRVGFFNNYLKGRVDYLIGKAGFGFYWTLSKGRNPTFGFYEDHRNENPPFKLSTSESTKGNYQSVVT